MRHSSLAAAALIAVLLPALAACGSTPRVEQSETPTVTATAMPSATPTADALQVVPNGTPPVAFAHDCNAVLTEAQVSDATGFALQFETSDSSGTMTNVGGLRCSWRGDSGSLVVEVIPQAGIGGTALPAASEKYYFEDCDPNWVCAWDWQSDELWVAGTFQFVPDMTRANVDAWGAVLGEQIGANFAAKPDEPWVRDRTGWWPALDCQSAADAIGRELGTALVGTATTLGDPPTPGYAMSGVASNFSECSIAEPGAANGFMYLGTLAGMGETNPDGYTPIDLGVAGITAYSGGMGAYGGEQYYLSDGVNSVSIEVRATSSLPPETVAVAVARAAASGFQ